MSRTGGDPGDVLDSGEAGGRIIRGGAARTAAYVAGILIGLVSTPLMVRHLGVVDFGRFVTVGSLIFIATGLTEGGLAAIGVREFAVRQGNARRQLMRDLIGLRLVLALAGYLGALAFAVLAGYDDVLVTGTLIAGAMLLPLHLYGALTVPLSVWLRLGWLAALDLIRQVITAVLIIALVVAGASLEPFFAVGVAAAAAAAFGAWLLARRDAPLRPAFDSRRWRVLLRDSLPYGAAIAVSVLYFRVAVILMSVVSTDEEAGYYGLAFRVIEIVSGIPYLLVSSAFPVLARAARDDDARLRYSLQRIFEVSLILGGAVALAASSGAGFAVEVVGGRPEFERSVDPLAVLAVGMMGTFLVATWAHALLTLRRHRALFLSNVAAFGLGTVLVVILASEHGALGAAIATAATEWALALTYLVVLVRARPDLRPGLGIAGPVALAAAVAAVPGYLLGLPSGVAATLATAAYFGVLAALRAIPVEVLDAVRRRGAPAEAQVSPPLSASGDARESSEEPR